MSPLTLLTSRESPVNDLGFVAQRTMTADIQAHADALAALTVARPAS